LGCRVQLGDYARSVRCFAMMPAIGSYRRIGVFASMALLIAGCGSAHDRSRKASSPSSPLYSQAAATAVASKLVAAVPLPTKTTRVTQPPLAATTELEKELGRPRNSEHWAKAADRYVFWSSTEYPTSLLAFLERHGPASKQVFSGWGGTRARDEGWSEELE